MTVLKRSVADGFRWSFGLLRIIEHQNGKGIAETEGSVMVGITSQVTKFIVSTQIQ